jgi:hypothetical protein
VVHSAHTCSGLKPLLVRRWKAGYDFLVSEADIAIIVGNNVLLWQNPAIEVADAHVATLIVIAKIHTHHLQGVLLVGQRKYTFLQVYHRSKEAEAAKYQTL